MDKKKRRYLLSFGFYRITFYFLTTYDTYMMIYGRTFKFIDFEIEG